MSTPGAHVPAADAMLTRQQFVHADCLWTDGRFHAWRIVDDRLVLAPEIALDLDDLEEAIPYFLQLIAGATYGGGESTAHGSCGFFFKRGATGLERALFSLSSDPFVGVEATPTQARFQSQCGDVWIVEHGDIARTRIERSAGR